MKIALVNSPAPFLPSNPVFPPLGLLTLSAVLKKEGYTNIEFHDMLGEETKDIFADIFFVYVNTPQSNYTKKLVEYLKIINPNSKFIAGGVHATFMPNDLQYFDSVVIGEGENAVIQILKEYPNIKKIYKCNKIENLDNIPFPDRDIIDIKQYANNLLFDGIPTTTYMTSRGCSWGKCAFCSRFFREKVRYRSAQNIVNEIKEVKEKYGIVGAMFFDDEFLSNKKRLKELCKLIKPLNIKWRCLCRIESISNEIIKLIKDAGCIGISVGIESGDQRILNIVSKNITIEKAKNAIKILKDNNLYFKEFIIVGLPGEDLESIKNTDKFINETKPYDIDISVFCVLPGSDIWDNMEKYDIKFNKNCRGWYKGNSSKYHKVCPVSTSKLTFDQILKARDELENKYKPKSKIMELKK